MTHDSCMAGCQEVLNGSNVISRPGLVHSWQTAVGYHCVTHTNAMLKTSQSTPSQMCDLLITKLKIFYSKCCIQNCPYAGVRLHSRIVKMASHLPARPLSQLCIPFRCTRITLLSLLARLTHTHTRMSCFCNVKMPVLVWDDLDRWCTALQSVKVLKRVGGQGGVSDLACNFYPDDDTDVSKTLLPWHGQNTFVFSLCMA